MSKSTRNQSGPIVHRRYPGRQTFDVPRETFDLACRRTEFLFAVAEHQTLSHLLACAWMQGLADADQALGRQPIVDGESTMPTKER